MLKPQPDPLRATESPSVIRAGSLGPMGTAERGGARQGLAGVPGLTGARGHGSLQGPVDGFPSAGGES